MIGERCCPVCLRGCGSHREPVTDRRREIVVYHLHLDGADRPCEMSGRCAALAAVAFTLRAA